ncbi:MAG: hypothetical protein A2113_01045 [Candidatus Woykebacteria bacterium GWA1_44_8]|uniref:3D domain-containing protein n=1 Tax=Candidatus Woykebacteria bacterium GWA1_44_8 TaxID=1802591 RepID=A0A1G1W2K7_9BACT|nr:MAG: hypothetical protein A2113_01045 [Candidatus Woykebacteria bacterium GWA1_44_8]
MLVLAAATLLTTLACQEKANTKVTPNHTTPTDAVATQPGTNRVYSLGVENQRKEISPTPNPPPSPTPEPTVAPREEVATPAPTARVITPKTVGAAGTDLLPPTGEQPGQTVEGVWLTFYDCDVEGYCGTTASGVTLKEGGPEEKERYAGCDPNYWSIGTNGTKMTIVGDPNGYIWKCVDTGSAVIGSAHWDVWFYSQTDGEAYLDTVGTIVTIKTLP